MPIKKRKFFTRSLKKTVVSNPNGIIFNLKKLIRDRT